MVTFGFIGFGSMARMLINSLMKYADVKPSDIAVTRKDKNKFHEISSVFPNIYIYETCAEIAINTRCIFICAKPADIKNILLEIKSYVNDNTHIISLAGTVKLENILKIIDGKVSKLIPTITSELGVGINLMCHSQTVSENDIIFLESYISKFGKIKRVNDNDIGFAAELTSCAPGFIASIFENMVEIATLHTSSFSYQEINEMISYTLYATSKLIIENDTSFEKVIERVATKGGITKEGVAVFDELLPNVFEKMFISTLSKRALVEERVNKDFSSI